MYRSLEQIKYRGISAIIYFELSVFSRRPFTHKTSFEANYFIKYYNVKYT